MSQAFNLQQFRSAFEVFQKIKSKLQPFLAQFKELNMQWIIGGLEQLFHLFHDEGVQINYKFHSIFGIKLIFDLADPFLINLIEIYFLPKMLQIASYQTDKSNDKRGQDYFARHGYPADTPELAKMGFTWVKLASEFICAAAVVKPKKMFEMEELEQPSKYALALSKLEQTGWKKYPTPAYYKEGTPETIRKNYLNNLQSLDEDRIGTFSDYYVEQYRLFIENDRPYAGKLDPKKFIENCDSFVTTTLISLCVQQFAHPSLKRKLNTLQLVNSMIKWGDIEAAHLVNCTDFIDQVAKEVANPNIGSKALSRGKHIFEKNNSGQELKKQFYVEFLKCIQFWALCYPKGIKKKGKQSKVKAFHDQLRTKLELQFPEDRQLKEKKATFDKAYERQKKRNEALLQQLDEEDPAFVSFIGKQLPLESNPYMGESTTKRPPPEAKPAQSKKKIESNSIISETPAGPTAPTPLGSDYQIWKKQIAEVSKSIDNIGQHKSKVDITLARIESFRMRYEKDLESADLSEKEFDQIFMSAQTLLEKIEKIQPYINKYRASSISYDQLVEAVTGRKLASSRALPKEEKKKQEKVQEKRHEKSVSSNNLPSLNGSIISKQRHQHENQHKIQAERKEKKSAMAQIADEFDRMTPIKKAQFGQEDSKDMSLLPGISRHSLEKEQENIEPASHSKMGQVRDIKQDVVDYLDGAKKSSVKKIKELQGNTEELEQEVEQGIGAKVPKSLKSIGGAYKVQTQSSIAGIQDKIEHQIQAIDSRYNGHEQNVEKSKKVDLVESRKSSNSRVNFAESMASHISRNLDDDDDIIMAPDSNPLEESFHQIRNENKNSFKKQLSFKQCFEEDKYLFGNDRFEKKYKLAADTFNLIKRSDSSGRKSRNKQSSISIPSLLNERNKKFEEEVRYIQDKKNRKINELQGKIKALETTGQVMKERLVQQQRQMKSMRANSEAGYSVKKVSIMEDQDIVYKRFAAQNKSVKERSFYGDSKTQSKYLDPTGTLIHSKRFSNYFEQFKNEKQKRLLLKNKQLLLKTEGIEFGFMSKRDHQNLVVTYYITPAKDLDGLVSKVDLKDDNLSVQVEPKNIPSIRKGKQEKVIVTVRLNGAPYYLPEIEFTYSLQNRLETQKFLIPCAFHKFVTLESISENQIRRYFDMKEHIKRGQQVPYSRKLLKNISMLADYLPGGTLLRGGEPNEKGQIQFAARAVWRQNQFWIRLMVKPSQFLYIQLHSRSQSNIGEFYSALLTNLLKKNIDLQQM